MDFQDDTIVKRRISWGSIIAGIFTVMAIFILLFILGSSLGISMISPKSNDIMNGAGTTVLIWTLVSILISLAGGAFVTGRLAGVNGSVHGFLVWATSLIISLFLGSMLVSSVLSMMGHAVGTISSTTGSVLGGMGSASGDGIAGTFNMGKKAFKNLDLNTDINKQNLNQNVIEALKKSDVPALHPDFLASQLKEVKNEGKHALKEIGMNPNNADNIISNLVNDLKKRTDTISQSINRDDVERAISNNTNLTPKEAEQTVNNIMAFHQKITQEANDKLGQLQKNLQDAKEQFNAFKQEAKEKADVAVKMIARLSFWSFVALLIGAIVSAACGMLGAKTVEKEHHHPISRDPQPYDRRVN